MYVKSEKKKNTFCLQGTTLNWLFGKNIESASILISYN